MSLPSSSPISSVLPTHKLASVLRNYLGLPPAIVNATVFGQVIRVREGLWRHHTDYDDAWFVACARRSRSLIDVGANVGYDALLAQLVPRLAVLEELTLIEANPTALALAAESLILNSRSNCARFIHAFAGASTGESVELWTVGSGAAGSIYRSMATTAARSGAFIKVMQTTLDAVIETTGQRPDLIKVDVEGAEINVLRGGVKLASRKSARFLVEMHAPIELPMLQNAAGVLAWCHDVGYRAWYLAEHTELLKPEQVENRGRCHLLLQPAAWTYPDWLTHIPQQAPLETAL